MKIIRRTDADFEARLRPLMERTPFDPQVEAAVADILQGVRERGDEALAEYARTFDHVELDPEDFLVSSEDIAEAGNQVDAATREAIAAAILQVGAFAAKRLPASWSFVPRPGVTAGEQFAPLNRVGCYVPGGTAPLVSTVIHTVTLARAAGVREIVVVTPPGPDKRVHPAILHAAKQAGASEVYRLGGVYAIAALAFGTASVPRVEKIVGPGNAYVTAAKRQVYGYVSLDLVAGPSEIMIIADDSANPGHIAADMLSQAEHGSGYEQAVLLTTTPNLLQSVPEELHRQAQALTRSDCIDKVLRDGVFLVETADLDEAAALASRYAPEHLEIITRRNATLAKTITAAGAIFLGPWTPEPVGDFMAGPSHVLPTGGAARYFSGLTVEQFFRRMSVVQYRKHALFDELPQIARLAEQEGLDAHARSATIRADERR